MHARVFGSGNSSLNVATITDTSGLVVETNTRERVAIGARPWVSRSDEHFVFDKVKNLELFELNLSVIA